MTKINDDLDYTNNTIRNTPINTKSMESLGWKYEPHGPSAEGPTFSKENYFCQKLAYSSVNTYNAGADPRYDMHIWLKHQDETHTLFFGRCPNLEHFAFLCKLLLIDLEK